MKVAVFIIVSGLLLSSCSENFSNGERIGLVTQFSNTGLFWKSWEGHLNVTQTGMNSSIPWDFSIDNDREDQNVIATLDSAARHGWKVRVVYHSVKMKNWFSNRGHTNYFVTQVQVLEKSMPSMFSSGNLDSINYSRGRIIDTIYLVIDKSKLKP